MNAEVDTHATALRNFARFPVASTVWLGLIGVSGIVYAAVLGTARFEDADQEREVQLVGVGVGAAVLITAVGFLIRLVLAWRRDLTAAALVAHDRPEAAWAEKTAFREASLSCWTVLATVVLGVAGATAVTMAAREAPWGWLTVVGLFIVVVSLFVAVRFRGSEYVGVHPDGIRVVRRGELFTASWPQVRHYANGQVGIDGAPWKVGVSGEAEERIRERSDAVGLATFADRLRSGESIDLGGVTLRPTALQIGGETLPWTEITAVVYEYDSENSWTFVVAVGEQPRQRGKAMTTDIANFPVFEEALLHSTGFRITGKR